MRFVIGLFRVIGKIDLKFEVSSSINKNLAPKSGFQKVWEILLLKKSACLMFLMIEILSKSNFPTVSSADENYRKIKVKQIKVLLQSSSDIFKITPNFF